MKFRYLAIALLALFLPFLATSCGDDSTGDLSESEISKEFEDAGIPKEQADCMAGAYLGDSIRANRLTVEDGDIEEFRKLRHQLDDQLLAGDVSAGFAIYERYRERLVARLERVTGELHATIQAMDFSKRADANSASFELRRTATRPRLSCRPQAGSALERRGHDRASWGLATGISSNGTCR